MCVFGGVLLAQSSSSSPDAPARTQESAAQTRRGVEQAGSAITLEYSEALFQMAAGLNACGYDGGLEQSLPVRAAVRDEVNAQVSASAETEASRDALCVYVKAHHLEGPQNVAQYVSLAVFLTPPPEMVPSVPETTMPPDALQVVNVLPLLRAFAGAAHLHAIFIGARPQYEAAVLQVHDAITRMILDTNIYLHQPVSSYDGRRFSVLLEPLLGPQAVNARIYGNDYFVVTSPAPITDADPNRVATGARAAGIHMDEVRHVYLLYMIDPILYARASATERLQPILKPVQSAPIDFLYKNDINAFVTECMIKAIEARTMDAGFAKPAKPVNVKQRLEIENYNAALVDYEKRAEAVRRRQIATDLRQGWVLTAYLYDKLQLTDHDGVSLKENLGEILYGMDVQTEVGRAKRIDFFAEGSPELAGGTLTRTRAPRKALTPMDQAELRLQKGDRAGAEDLAEKELKTNPRSGAAQYVLARAKLMEGDPQGAFDGFGQVLANSKDPRTVAWAHVYLGRLYDAQQQPDRAKAVAEYKAAIAVPGAQGDVVAAAQGGLKKPFTAPKRTVSPPDQTTADDQPLDPTGKQQKESYSATEEKKPQ